MGKTLTFTGVVLSNIVPLALLTRRPNLGLTSVIPLPPIHLQLYSFLDLMLPWGQFLF